MLALAKFWINFSKIKNHLILILLTLEFIYLFTLTITTLTLNSLAISLRVVFVLIVFIVSEACVGLRLIVFLRRVKSQELEIHGV